MIVQQRVKIPNRLMENRKPDQKVRYGCVFCVTGREESVAVSLEAQNHDLRASPVSQVKYKSFHGIKSTEQKIIMPGYVYFQTKSHKPPDLRYVEDSIRLLCPSEKNWALWGMDEWFAKWLFENHGVIGMSKARINAENRVEAVIGPLKILEDYIRRVDKRGHGAQVALPFYDREVLIWLPYELVQ